MWSKTDLIVVCDDEEKKKYKEGSTEYREYGVETILLVAMFRVEKSNT